MLVLLIADLVEVVALDADHLAAVRTADDVGAVGVAGALFVVDPSRLKLCPDAIHIEVVQAVDGGVDR
ncbi:hypothetical protein D3C80_1707390 [compost metagenome]